jgi:hypothetical protein
MRKTRRLAMIGIAIVATGALFAGTAAADTANSGVTAEQAGGTATASALKITLFGTELTGSDVTAKVFGAADNPAPNAQATVGEILTPAFTLDPLDATTTARGATTSDTPDKCLGDDLEAVPGIVGLKISCGTATSKLDGTDGGESHGLGGELLLEPSISELLGTIQLQDPANQVEQGVIDGLNQLIAPLAGNPIGDLANEATQTVDQVLKGVLNLDTTVRVAIAPARADVVQTAEGTTSTAHAQGVRVDLLPLDVGGDINNLLPSDLAPSEPLVSIIIGDAFATKSVHNNGSDATSDAQSSLVKIVFGSSALTDALGLSAKPIEIGAGQHVCILEGTPLESCVDVATAGVDANGNPFANGVSLALLKGVNGGIGLGTSSVTSGAAALLPKLALPADLPRTGGNPALPLIGGGLLCLAAVTRRLAFGRK